MTHEELKKQLTDEQWEELVQAALYMFSPTEIECMWKDEYTWRMMESIKDANELMELLHDGYQPIPF